MCQYNLRVSDSTGEGLAQKRTTIMTNSLVMGEFLARKCCGGHTHIPLKGGTRCSKAAIYTPEFAEAIVESYKLHLASMKKSSGKHSQKGSLKARDCMDQWDV